MKVSTSPLLDEYYVDFGSEDGVRLLGEKLLRYGIATFGGIPGIGKGIEVARELGKVVAHRDSDEYGVTFIRDLHSQEQGYHGFTNERLALHTDQSCCINPPDLIFAFFEKQADLGGESIFCDGREVCLSLRDRQKACVFEELITHNFIWSSASRKDTFMGPVLERKRGKFVLRFRSDDLVVPCDDSSVLDEFSEIAQSLAFPISLAENQGYVVQNTRWLHGRESFTGERVMCRILLDVGCEENRLRPLNGGFVL